MQRGSSPLPRLIALLAICAALGGWTYRYALRDNLFPRNFGVVEEGRLYRSGRLTPAATQQVVSAHRIRTIVDLGAYPEGSPADRVAADTARALGVARHVFRLEGDGTGDPNMYVEALRIIADPAAQPVLVHCSAGAQRTTGCVALYRSIVQDRPLPDAIAEGYGYKHDPHDNTALRPYLEKYRDAIAAALAGGGRVRPLPADRAPETGTVER